VYFAETSVSIYLAVDVYSFKTFRSMFVNNISPLRFSFTFAMCHNRLLKPFETQNIFLSTSMINKPVLTLVLLS